MAVAQLTKDSHIPVCLLELRINFQVDISVIIQKREWPGASHPSPRASTSCLHMNWPICCPQPSHRSRHIFLVDSAPIPGLALLQLLPQPLSVAYVNSFRTGSILLLYTWCIKTLNISRTVVICCLFHLARLLVVWPSCPKTGLLFWLAMAQ